jgi:hypothetical protein
MKPKTQAGKTGAKLKRRKPVQCSAVVRAQPDQDLSALAAACKAMESHSCPRMVKATLDFLNSKYGSPGVL